MLTPSGLINNTLVDSGHYLNPYYFKEIQLPEGFSFFPTLLFVMIQTVLSGLLLVKLSARKSK